MNKHCKNCDTPNSEHARFCAKCGSALHSQESLHDKVGERTPAEHTTKMAEKTRDEIGKLTAKTKHIWNNLTRDEKIMAIGAIIGLVAFALPWVSADGQSVNGFNAGSNSIYAYLLPLLMITSLVLLYFTQGASDTRKALTTRWQIVIGSVGGTIGIFMVLFISIIGSLFSQMMGGFGALLGGSSLGVNTGIGAYLFAAGAITIAVGAFNLQSELFRRFRSNN